MGFGFRRFRRWTAVVFVVVLAMALVWHWMGTRAYDRELKAWQAVGGLASIREADAGPISDEANAAAFWLKAYETLPPKPTGFGGDRFPPEHADIIEEPNRRHPRHAE